MKFVKYITAVLLLTLLNTAIASKRNNNQPVTSEILMQDKARLAEKHFYVGVSFLKLNKYQEAIENFDLAIKYNPNLSEAYNNKGFCLGKLGQL
ncbi:tetratricopeptide repeat protein [Orientia tsutsugamushi]|uniref:TPR repeat-containing protein 03 n=1 Tax=Orientia tsutsugamushi TaxID=784 RepID=A0A2U3QU12_ORITS|nr:tetratricopeptide repeat protein [Orientia tsutsugamushi]KJV53624.1 TPR repeat family protein [Orientia tsutsugamushi str. Kato PP]SPR04443.1 TPR repeat-containing protein 03 [Orientia tsutsugamushi]